MVTGADDSTIGVWDLESGAKSMLFTNAHDNEEITCMTFDKSWRRLMTGARNGVTKVTCYNQRSYNYTDMGLFSGYSRVGGVDPPNVNASQCLFLPLLEMPPSPAFISKPSHGLKSHYFLETFHISCVAKHSMGPNISFLETLFSQTVIRMRIAWSLGPRVDYIYLTHSVSVSL